MWANPEPHDVASVQNAQGAIVDTHTHRVRRTPPAHALEIQTWMLRVRGKERTHAYSSSVARGRVRPARCSDSAASARRSSRFSDSGEANSSVHRPSDANSAIRRRASLSCSVCGSSEGSRECFLQQPGHPRPSIRKSIPYLSLCACTLCTL